MAKIFLLLILLIFPQNVFSISKTIVINSYRVAGEKSTDEFVELYNTGAEKINISGWQLSKKTALGTKYDLVASFPSAEILPQESLIVGHRDSTENPDVFYTSNYSIAEDNTISLFSDAGKTIVDKVGFGKAGDFEGKAASTASTNVWARKGADTDNNFDDFSKKETSVNKDFSGICLTEMMPSPAEGKEWFEIYNSEVSKDISGLTVSDKFGSVKKYTIPEGTKIDEGQYLVFYADKTGISLNNDGDGLILADMGGKVFDDSGENYGVAKKGYSYAFDGERWRWTKNPTPAAKNIIIPVSDAEESETILSKKRTSAKNTTATSKKGKAPAAEVAGAQNEGDENSIFTNKSSTQNPSDRILGIIFIGVAIFLAFSYTLYANKEKLIALYNKKHEGNEISWREIREKMRRWRDFSFVGRVGRWKDTICKRISGRS